MGLSTDVKLVFFGVIAFFLIVVFASVYFALTSPSGQQGLVGIFQSLGNAIVSPFTSLFDGAGTVIRDFFNGIGNAISHLF